MKTHEACLEDEATADLPGRAITPARLLYTDDPDILIPMQFAMSVGRSSADVSDVEMGVVCRKWTISRFWLSLW